MKLDFAERIRRLQQKVAENLLDAYLVTSQESIYYLSGASYKPLERPFFIIVRPQGEPGLVVPELERAHMQKAQGFGDVQAYFDYPSPPGQNWFDRLNENLTGCKRIGLEPSAPFEIASALSSFKVVPCGLVSELRLVKTKEEVALIRNAARWADLGMERIIKSLYAGISVLELFSLSRAIQTQVIKTGEYDPLASEFLTVGWPAPKSSQPHSVPGLEDRLSGGPLALMSFLRINGYAAECERTAFMDKPTEKEKEFFQHIKKAREIAFAMVKPGTPCAEIDAATRNYFASQGLLANILHRTGHGIGLGNHEAPWLAVGCGDVLEENMVVSIEPGLYPSEVGGFRHSDTVLVTSGGYECLTKYPTSIEELTLPPAKPLKSLKGHIIRSAVGLK